MRCLRLRKEINEPLEVATAVLSSYPIDLYIQRELQRGVPPPHVEQFSKETLIRSASKPFAATTEARTGEHTVS